MSGKQVPIYRSPGGVRVNPNTLPGNVKLKEADTCGGQPVPKIPNVGDVRSDGKAFHCGVYNPDHNQIDFHKRPIPRK